MGSLPGSAKNSPLYGICSLELWAVVRISHRINYPPEQNPLIHLLSPHHPFPLSSLNHNITFCCLKNPPPLHSSRPSLKRGVFRFRNFGGELPATVFGFHPTKLSPLLLGDLSNFTPSSLSAPFSSLTAKPCSPRPRAAFLKVLCVHSASLGWGQTSPVPVFCSADLPFFQTPSGRPRFSLSSEIGPALHFFCTWRVVISLSRPSSLLHPFLSVFGGLLPAPSRANAEI